MSFEATDIATKANTALHYFDFFFAYEDRCREGDTVVH